ncbi:hypothetical protein [Rubritalea tangerina]
MVGGSVAWHVGSWKSEIRDCRESVFFRCTVARVVLERNRHFVLSSVS